MAVRYRVSRLPQNAPLAGKATRRDRRARGKEVVESKIRTIPANATRGLSDPLAKGRALYRVVLARMAYDKVEAGWGEGDSVRACRIRRPSMSKQRPAAHAAFPIRVSWRCRSSGSAGRRAVPSS